MVKLPQYGSIKLVKLLIYIGLYDII